jgi:hypothetical protein
MLRYEAVCDCCMGSLPLWSEEIENRDCPLCGVGKLLGPFRASGRFSNTSGWDHVSFRREEPLQASPD